MIMQEKKCKLLSEIEAIIRMEAMLISIVKIPFEDKQKIEICAGKIRLICHQQTCNKRNANKKIQAEEK